MLAWEISTADCCTHSSRPRFLQERAGRRHGISGHTDAAARRAAQLDQRARKAGNHVSHVNARRACVAQILANRPHQHHHRLLSKTQAALARRHLQLQTKRRKLNAHLHHVEVVRQAASQSDARFRLTVQHEILRRLAQSAARRQQLLQLCPRLEAQHGRRIVAAAKIQCWFRWIKLRRALDTFGQTALASCRATPSFEDMRKRLADRATLQIVRCLFKRVLSLAPASLEARPPSNPHRVFLAAFMMERFPETVLSAPDAPRETKLRKAAHAMLAAFFKWNDFRPAAPLQRTVRGGRCQAFFATWTAYVAAFQDWKSADYRVLLEGLTQHFRELAALRVSVSTSAETRAEWWPNIERQQAAILKRLSSLGEVELASQLTKEAGQFEVQLSSKKRKRQPSNETASSPISSVSSTGSPTEIAMGLPPLVSDPAPKMVTEAVQRLEGLVNAQLAHEIALDDRFQLPEPAADHAEDGALRQQLLSGDLSAQCRALELIRDGLMDTTLPRHHTLRAQIMARLDSELLKQQATHQGLEWASLQTYVLDTVSRLCAPQRDSLLAELRLVQDPVDFFGQVKHLLRLMKTDLVNFQIETIRPHIRQYAVEYEVSKFAACVHNGDITLTRTRTWLAAAWAQVSLGPTANEGAGAGPSRLAVIDDAFVLLASSTAPLSDDQMPETWAMDWQRLVELTQSLQTVILIACCHALTVGAYPWLSAQAAFIKQLCEDLTVLVKDLADPFEHMENVALHVRELVRTACEPLQIDPPVQSVENRVMEVLLKLSASEHPIRGLMTRRAMDVLRKKLKQLRHESGTNAPERVHGFDPVSERLHSVIQRMATMADHNRIVYAEFYDTIISALPPPAN